MLEIILAVLSALQLAGSVTFFFMYLREYGFPFLKRKETEASPLYT